MTPPEIDGLTDAEALAHVLTIFCPEDEPALQLFNALGIRVTGKVGRAIHVMALRHGRIISGDTLLQSVHRQLAFSPMSSAKLVHRARTAIARHDMPAEITTHYGLGYSLHVTRPGWRWPWDRPPAGLR